MLTKNGLKRALMQKNYSSFEQGDIIVAQLLFSEQIGVKRRPAIVISSSSFNKKSDDLIVLKISSKEKMTEFDIPLTQEDLSEGKIKTESKIMVDNPVTLFKGMIEAKIAKATKQKLQQVKQKTKELYEL